MLAARSQTYQAFIKPALAEVKTMICDRGWSSTTVYQIMAQNSLKTKFYKKPILSIKLIYYSCTKSSDYNLF